MGCGWVLRWVFGGASGSERRLPCLLVSVHNVDPSNLGFWK